MATGMCLPANIFSVGSEIYMLFDRLRSRIGGNGSAAWIMALTVPLVTIWRLTKAALAYITKKLYKSDLTLSRAAEESKLTA
jgi:hypothetical protein